MNKFILIKKLRKALLNFVVKLFFLVVHVAANFDAAINYFSPSWKKKLINSFIVFFSVHCVEYCVGSREVINCF